MQHETLEAKRKGDRYAGSPYPVGSSVNRGCPPSSSRRKRFNLGALGSVDMVPARQDKLLLPEVIVILPVF